MKQVLWIAPTAIAIAGVGIWLWISKKDCILPCCLSEHGCIQQEVGQ